ncbi:MAG: phosphate ABC transporter ATP-binding protein [Candidatus Firestonebacteria bacterium RIFOXYC2_FULL_39_67]|nr:MAG: phosphate ABC transporter ATP-binding protein [Candidatus Firestonebacteria bacterium RIFOXYD2_FULL_39_29]OGF56456.1 MAG: phosphate ABC transporter ATP-binding protein [Candidatus Firestonebacteria bacterium RIFOXYC2_FULL_39_67]
MVETLKEKIVARDLNCWFGTSCSVKNLNLTVYSNEILGIIGPSNSGKTTFLRMINRLNEVAVNFRYDGSITLDGIDVRKIDTETLRKRCGMVFALPLPLPMSIYENVGYGPLRHGIKSKKEIDIIVEKSLIAASLWDEVKDRLDASAMKLSGGQQQRLCIARTLAVEPEVILYDEPCSGLDPISTAKVEEAMIELKKKYTIVLVTNNVKQASRVSDRTAFFLMGELIEIDKTADLFVSPKDKRTEGYITGRYG